MEDERKESCLSLSPPFLEKKIMLSVRLPGIRVRSTGSGQNWDHCSGVREDWEAGPAVGAPVEAGCVLGASPLAVSRGMGLSQSTSMLSLVKFLDCYL